MTGPVQAVQDLSAAFAARDLEAALACFIPGDDIGYAGSERTETATGRPALVTLLAELFQRDEAYAWTPTTVTVHEHGTTAYVFAEANGLLHPDDGTDEPFPYRVSGLVERVGDRWLWRHCLGSEPTQ
jgi:ketosteroid isomerase-like protein